VAATPSPWGIAYAAIAVVTPIGPPVLLRLVAAERVGPVTVRSDA